MKKKSHEILEQTRQHILSENFKNTYRAAEHDFSRNYLVTFPFLIIFILNLVRKSLQSELNSFIKILSLPSVSKQVFSAARKKILPTAFVDLNHKLVNEFYTDNEFSTFHGYRLIVVDGSTLQLPESSSIRESYGACSNQNPHNNMCMARTSHAYDPLSGITLDGLMRPYADCERRMIFDHILNIQPSNCAHDLYLLDRGYPSITLIFFLMQHGINFVMRCSTAWLSLVNDVLKSGKKDAIIEICPRMLVGQKRRDFEKRLPGVCLKSRVKIRVLVIKLSTGEEEVLITSLINKDEYKYKMFQGLYHLRWGGEENYKFHKVRVEIENFSGKTCRAIEQDFNATIFTANVRALIAQEAQEELDQVHPKDRLKYNYKINKNISIGILKDEIAEYFSNPDMDLYKFCTSLKQDMKKSVVPIRPGRSYRRIRKYNHKFPMNRRRSL